LGKLDGGIKVNRERLIQGIHANLSGYPAHLNLEEQGLFAVGYYHQRQAFFTSKEKEPVESTTC
jgi:CRISPR-associated protein Csd1